MKIHYRLNKTQQHGLNKHKLLTKGKCLGLQLVNITKSGDLVCRVSGTEDLVLVKK